MVIKAVGIPQQVPTEVWSTIGMEEAGILAFSFRFQESAPIVADRSSGFSGVRALVHAPNKSINMYCFLSGNLYMSSFTVYEVLSHKSSPLTLTTTM